MSILEVKNLSHGFGDRAIFEDVSFRLLKGEHIGLVGANGEGKSTFMSIVTGKMLPDEGKVEWSKYVTAGYLDQHSVLAERQSVRDVLRTAFDELFKAEARINDLYMKMAEDGADVDALMEEVGELQDRLESRDFYTLDAKIDEVARALGVMDFGMDTDVTSLSGGQRTKVLLAKLLLEKPDILLLDEPTNYLDAEHIDWLKRYLQNYENAFVLISHDIPFLNDVINIVYHVENQQLTRYSGDYYQFQEVYAMKKSQLEAAYERQQKGLQTSRTLWLVIKPVLQLVIWLCLVKRNWIRWILSNSKVRNQNHPLISNQLVHQGALSSKPRTCKLVTTVLLLSL
ncbi:ABC transporter ATP-binding protein [Streptococcus pneumoniae]|nr:ABC transporter ATP-binding protein [Streptococcus pneumoniae]